MANRIKISSPLPIDGIGSEKLATQEREFFENPKKLDWDELERSQNYKHNRQLHKLRKTHSAKLFNLIVFWLVAEFTLVLFSGFGRIPLPIGTTDFPVLNFKLDKAVLIALLGTTTATVLGLYAIAARWLFTSNSQTKSKNATEK